MRKTFIIAMLALLEPGLTSCGSGSQSVDKSSSPDLERRRAQAAIIRENSRKGVVQPPVRVDRTGDARVDGYRVLMETRRRAMDGLGPDTTRVEAAIAKSPRSSTAR